MKKALLRDNFAAAEMLWKQINETSGRVFRLSKLLKHVPRASRRHLKGLRSKDVYEVFHRMLFYFHYNIGASRSGRSFGFLSSDTSCSH